MMQTDVRLYAPAAPVNEYGESPVGTTYITVKSYLRVHQRVDYDAETEDQIDSGTCWLAEVVPGLSDEWVIEVPDFRSSGWRKCAIEAVDAAYDETGTAYYQAVKFAERRKGARAGGTVF